MGHLTNIAIVIGSNVSVILGSFPGPVTAEREESNREKSYLGIFFHFTTSFEHNFLVTRMLINSNGRIIFYFDTLFSVIVLVQIGCYNR